MDQHATSCQPRKARLKHPKLQCPRFRRAEHSRLLSQGPLACQPVTFSHKFPTKIWYPLPSSQSGLSRRALYSEQSLDLDSLCFKIRISQTQIQAHVVTMIHVNSTSSAKSCRPALCHQHKMINTIEEIRQIIANLCVNFGPSEVVFFWNDSSKNQQVSLACLGCSPALPSNVSTGFPVRAQI